MPTALRMTNPNCGMLASATDSVDKRKNGYTETTKAHINISGKSEQAYLVSKIVVGIL